MQSHKISIAKSFSWRIIASIITMIASYIVTGKLDFALGIGTIDFFVKIITYFIHERVWLKITSISNKNKANINY